jgi:hypothetical protein
MTMESIMKANGKKDTNMDKATCSSAMGAIVVANSWKISSTDMLSTIGQDKKNIEEGGR